MKYEVIKAEIIRVQSEDVLTLSINDKSTQNAKAWADLGFVDPLTGEKV